MYSRNQTVACKSAKILGVALHNIFAQCLQKYEAFAVDEAPMCRSVCEDFYEVCGNKWKKTLQTQNILDWTILFTLLGDVFGSCCLFGFFTHVATPF